MSTRPPKPRKELHVSNHASVGTFRQLRNDPLWKGTILHFDHQHDGYPEFGQDMQDLLTQYSSGAVVAAIETAYNAVRRMAPLIHPQTKTQRQLEREDKKNRALNRAFNAAAAQIADAIEYPSDGSQGNERRAFKRKKTMFFIARKMMQEMREADIQTKAKDRDRSASFSGGYEDIRNKIHAATEVPFDASEASNNAPSSGHEDEYNPAAQTSANAEMLSATNENVPDTQKFMEEAGGQPEVPQEEVEDVTDQAEEDLVAQEEANQAAQEQVTEVPEETIENTETIATGGSETGNLLDEIAKTMVNVTSIQRSADEMRESRKRMIQEVFDEQLAKIRR